MIALNIQLLSLGISFLYGILFFILLEINSRFLYSSSMIVKILCSFMFVLFNTLFYFFILLKINNGYVHIYFLMCVFGGYFLCKVIYKRLLKRKGVWYTISILVGDNSGKKEKEIFC